MTERFQPGDAYLRVIADQVRAAGTTPRRRTVALARRWWVALTLVVAACGSGGGRRDTHARGVAVQEACCEHLQGGDRDRCLQEVVRVDDVGAAGTATNQQTYACVVEHFVCDPRTGRETRESAQAQHDCTDDLQ